ncbi:MAG TPA: lipopolysaccharide core heptose(I) kinase RfaP [Methylophilaceae bacterium]
MRLHEHIEAPHWLHQFFIGRDTFDSIMQLQGEVFRDVPGRKTIRVRIGGKPYFVKQHFGVGWREIFKNLTSAKWPVLTAATEWRAIARLEQLGIPTTPAVAYGVRGLNPAKLQSFLITEDLGDIISLETLCAGWRETPPDPGFKRKLLIRTAELARKLHDGGMNHRDFYICHICLDNARQAQGEIHLYLIDLHRVGIRRRIRCTDRMKDMAAMYFSSMDAGLTRRDYLRFLRHYCDRDLRSVFGTDSAFWRRVAARAVKLYVKFHGRMPETVI